ncbi:hypothetical protein WAK64_04990 [Bacillus spongiae]|uniref:Uncharacterized protein n=1 Tax=Bacillus spongiae TaxID=2683610 RepID=A0ABU8HB87_9BACI
MNKKKSNPQFLPDTDYEGKHKAYLDVDRFINEGMSGGSVHMGIDKANIEECVDIFLDESPSNETK